MNATWVDGGSFILTWGGSTNSGTPQWMVFVRENAIKMDDDWGYPHLWKPPLGVFQ